MIDFIFDLQRFYEFSGSGTETDPYKITSAADLQALATDVNEGNDCAGKTFKVTDNITLSGNWTPIGGFVNGSVRSFKGTFDGNGNNYQQTHDNGRQHLRRLVRLCR